MTTGEPLSPATLRAGSKLPSQKHQAGLAHAEHILAGVRTRRAQHERLALVATRMACAFKPVQG